jgi:tRNA (cytidine32/guanosine34-2'-O)-methyltransferase
MLMIVTGVHDLDAYLHSQLLLAVCLCLKHPADIQALTLALTLMAPQATLIFKIFLSPFDPHAAMLRSQLRLFFPGPMSIEEDMDGYREFDDTAQESSFLEDKLEQSRIGSQGYDTKGRRGGVWVRKPRSSRPGSGGTFGQFASSWS